jgi:hypothetical protein
MRTSQADKTADYEDVLTQPHYATDEDPADAPDASSEVALHEVSLSLVVHMLY